jgi:hypothetical protein
MRPLVAIVVLLSAAAVRPAAAQPARTVGVTMGYPAGIGVLWHVSDRIALRPDVVVTRGTTSTTTRSIGGATTGAQTDWTASGGLSALVTMRDIDRLRLYVVPRVAYVRAESSTDDTTGLGAFGSSTDGVLASGALGAQYGLGDRVAVYGEAGVQYLRQEFESAFGTSTSRATLTQVGLRSAIGLVVYF